MSKDTVRKLSGLVSSLNAEFFGETFESAMLHELSSLFHSSHLAIAYRRKDKSAKLIELCEFRGGSYYNEVLPAAAFAERFGFTFDNRLPSPAGLGRSTPDREDVAVMGYALKHHDCIIITAARGAILPGHVLALFNTIMELLLQARCHLREAMKIIDLSHERYTAVRHRMRGVISSITTVVQMLLSPEIPDEDKEELKALARQGVAELSDVIDGIIQTARQELRSQA